MEINVSFKEEQVEGHELRHTPTNDKAREFDRAVKFGTEEHVSFKLIRP
jgi:hypothetical protein